MSNCILETGMSNQLENSLFEESSTDENDSLSSSNLVRISQDLSKLFNSNDYYEILTLIPSLNKYSNLPSSARIIISLTLFKLGRVGAALRELSLTIETSSDPIEKEKLIKYLIHIFKNLGMVERAVASSEELISMAKLELALNNDNEEKKPKIQERLKTYELELNEFLDSSDNGHHNLIKKIGHLPIHEQAEAYIKFDGRLNDFALGRCCIISKKLTEEALTYLKMWKSNPKKIPPKDPLHKIFTALKYFGPLYVFDELNQNQDLLNDYVNFELDRHPEIDHAIEPKILVKQLYRWNHRSSSRTLMSLCGLIIKHQVVIGFFKLLNEDYVDAIDNFKWTLKFFAALEKRFKFFTNKNEYLSSITERVVGLLLCQCYNLGSLDCNERELGCLLSTLVAIEDINITTEYSSGRLSTYFISCGFIYERLSMIDSTIINIENEQQTPISSGSRLSKSYLNEMIRKYLIATTLKAHDDPTTMILYDRIIWGMLLYGGIHLKTFWFFVHLRNYFMIENDYGPLNFSPEKYRIFAIDDIISKYTNGWEILYKIYDLWDSLEEVEKENVWDINNGNTFLIPQIFDNGDKLILVDSFYDERSSYNGKNFSFISDYQVKHKLKGHIKLPGKIIQEHLEFSKDLVYIWCDSFMKYHGTVPEFILKLIEDLE